MPTILIADDQYEILHALKLLLKHEGFQTVMASSPEAVLDAARAQSFDLILIDLNYTRDTTSGREGLDLIGSLRQLPNPAPVIVMTAWSNVPLAVEAMRLGAVDFIEKPWANSRVLTLVQQHIHSDRKRSSAFPVTTDLEIARSVQTRLLPQRMPALRTLDCAVQYQPAGQVGGDYYDFLPAGEDAVAFVVADVSGKGISAAILMATIQSFFRSRRPEEFSDLIELLKTLNSLFLQSSPVEHYATVFLMRYSESDRSLAYVNCGHTPPLLSSRQEAPVELGPSATVLGMFADWHGSVEHGHLDVGDTLLIFSDGLSEAANVHQEEFGTERLRDHWDSWNDPCPAAPVRTIGETIRHHTAGPLSDDLTILALRGKPAQNHETNNTSGLPVMVSIS